MRVAVLMGGPSAEHEISLKTGDMVFENLDRNKYQPQKIVISKKGRWFLDGARNKPTTLKELENDFDVVFNAMHGEYGEDGTIQQILEKAKIPYTGSHSKASRLGMDKIESYRLFKKAGLATPPTAGQQWPAVVKPADRGSSVGVSIVRNSRDLAAALRLAKKYSPRVLTEEYIKGREITCGVIENSRRPKALPPTEIILKSSVFFDYHAKYTPGASEEITPARLSSAQTIMAQKAALKAHRVIGCSGYSRADFILGNDGRLYILEINTLPGLTATSLLPQAARAAGIGFSRLLDIIIKNAFNKNPQFDD